MSAALVPPFEIGNETIPRKRFTRGEVERLAEVGIFEGQRYELIDGDLIDKMGQKPLHATGIQLLMVALLRLFDGIQIRVQLPIEVSDADRERSVPEPDFAILGAYKSEYADRHPRGDELLLVIEVSDTTLSLDLKRKASLYAAAGVPEYWVLDVVRRSLIVHKHPEGAIYRLRQLLSDADTVQIEGARESLSIREILPAV